MKNTEVTAKAAIYVKAGSEIDRQPLLCFGVNVPITPGDDDDGMIGRLFVTPSGNVVVSDVMPEIERAKALRSWDCERLDEIASDYFYRKCGQAMRLIDAMAHDGHLTYSDETRFVESVNDNLRTADFILIQDAF